MTLIIFANSLVPDQVRYHDGPDLDTNCLTLFWVKRETWSVDDIKRKTTQHESSIGSHIHYKNGLTVNRKCTHLMTLSVCFREAQASSHVLDDDNRNEDSFPVHPEAPK